MARSVKFEGVNSVMTPPTPIIGQPAEQPIHTFKDGHSVVSCWQLTEAELREVAATGVVWLAARGLTMPPVIVSGAALVNIGNRHAVPLVGPNNSAVN